MSQRPVPAAASAVGRPLRYARRLLLRVRVEVEGRQAERAMRWRLRERQQQPLPRRRVGEKLLFCSQSSSSAPLAWATVGGGSSRRRRVPCAEHRHSCSHPPACRLAIAHPLCSHCPASRARSPVAPTAPPQPPDQGVATALLCGNPLFPPPPHETPPSEASAPSAGRDLCPTPPPLTPLPPFYVCAPLSATPNRQWGHLDGPPSA